MRVIGVRGGASTVEVGTEEGNVVLRLPLGATVDRRLIEALNHQLEWADLDLRPPLDYTQAAEVLGVSPRTLRRKVAQCPHFPHVRFGGAVRFLPDQIRQIRANGWTTPAAFVALIVPLVAVMFVGPNQALSPPGPISSGGGLRNTSGTPSTVSNRAGEGPGPWNQRSEP
jgi:hypothetical protein